MYSVYDSQKQLVRKGLLTGSLHIPSNVPLVMLDGTSNNLYNSLRKRQLAIMNEGYTIRISTLSL